MKDLEHSVVDPDWFLQNDPAAPYPTNPSIPGGNSGNIGGGSIIQQQQNQPQNAQVFQKPLPPPPPLAPSSMAATSQPTSSNNGNPTSGTVLIPSPFPSPSSILSSGNTNATKQIDKMEGGSNKFVSKDSFDFEIVEQLINEQQQFTDEVDPGDGNTIRDNMTGSQQSVVSDISAENRLQDQENISLNDPNENLSQDTENLPGSQPNSIVRKNPDSNLKYRDAASSIKRFDPKFRALTEAFRLKTEEDAKAAAIAAGTNIDPATSVNNSNARSSQDSGIMTQESSQTDSLNDSQDEKFYKYMASVPPSSSSGPMPNQASPNIRNRTHQSHPNNEAQTMHSSGNNMTMGMPTSSELSSPILNNDRYQQGYENSRMITNTDLLRQTNQQQIISQWNQVPKHERSSSVPNHSIPPPNYNCYMNQTNSSGGGNRESNLSIFVGTGTPPPQQQTLHSPSFMNCAQQSLQNDCMQHQTQPMETMHQNCRTMQENTMQSSVQRQNTPNQQHQLNHQQQMIQTPTHHPDVGMLPEAEPVAKTWPSQIVPTPRSQPLNSNELHPSGSLNQNYPDMSTNSNNPFSVSDYQPLVTNEHSTGLLVPSQNVANADAQLQSPAPNSFIKNKKVIVSMQNDSSENTMNQENSDMPHQDLNMPPNSSENIRNDDAKIKNENEKVFHTLDKDPVLSKPKISINDIHSDDHSLDPFFSGKVGKKKLASKHKLYSERIRKSKSSSHHNMAQQSLDVKQLGSSIQTSDSAISKSSSGQNQHIKKAKLLASSEHRKQVEHKSNLVKIFTKSEDKSKETYKVESEDLYVDRQLNKASEQNIIPDCSSVPMSYENEEIVTTEEPDIVSTTSPPHKLNIVEEDDSNLQTDNDESPFTAGGDYNSETPTNSVEAADENEEIVPNDSDNPVVKPPHKKRCHRPMDQDVGSNVAPGNVNEKDTSKLIVMSCEHCSYMATSAVSCYGKFKGIYTLEYFTRSLLFPNHLSHKITFISLT